MRLMKMMFAGTLMVILLGSQLAWAGKGDGGWNRLENRLKQLHLTEAQAGQLADLKGQFVMESEATRVEINNKKKELKEILAKGSHEKGVVAKKRDEITKLQDKFRNEKTAYGAKLWEMLTSEQQKKLGKNAQEQQNLFAQRKKTDKAPSN